MFRRGGKGIKRVRGPGRVEEIWGAGSKRGGEGKGIGGEEKGFSPVDRRLGNCRAGGAGVPEGARPKKGTGGGKKWAGKNWPPEGLGGWGRS